MNKYLNILKFIIIIIIIIIIIYIIINFIYILRELQLYPNGFSESFKNYVSLFMDNVDSLEDVSNHLCIKRVFYIRNMNDYSIYSSESKREKKIIIIIIKIKIKIKK